MANIKGPKRSVAGTPAITPRGSSGQSSKQVSRSGGTTMKAPRSTGTTKLQSHKVTGRQGHASVARGRKALGKAMGL